MPEYSPTAHAADRACVKRIRDVSEETLASFVRHFDPVQWWPYGLEEGRTPRTRSQGPSPSTGAMIAHALAVSTGTIRTSAVAPAAHTWRPMKAPKAAPGALHLDEQLRTVVAGLARGVMASSDTISTSPTWGHDDPLTLLWLYELLSSPLGADHAPALAKVRAAAVALVKRVSKRPAKPVLVALKKGTRAVPHPFPVLRALQLRAALLSETGADAALRATIGSGTGIDEVGRWLEQRLHYHLSQAEVRDGEFDAAQMIFALEALLSVRVDAVTSSVAARVNDVLRTQRPTNPHWRPVRPLTINAQGQILLPQSVEVANALLRVREVLDGGVQIDADLALLNDYCEWILAARRTVAAKGPYGTPAALFSGWQSEHTHADGLVHLWATSQVLLFLQHHGAALQQHIGRRTRDDVGVALSVPEIEPAEEGDDRPPWTILSDKEPLDLPPGSEDLVYGVVGKYFVTPRLGDPLAKASCSMLLHGPPGTGKTSFAQGLAAVLGFGFLTITPSDFIRSGEAGVEARAKALFDMLAEQSDVVVLFDEIDRLILGRDRADYGRQSDMFQFMTPSMLIKINDLRAQGSVVFIIATNYFERIDSAIKRSGRIDRQLLLMPPGRAQRRRIVRQLHKGRFGAERAAALKEEDVDSVARATSLFAFSEIKDLFERAVGDLGPAPGDARSLAGMDAQLLAGMKDKAGEEKPAIDIRGYVPRFEVRPDDLQDERMRAGLGPARELLMLVHDQLDAGRVESLRKIPKLVPLVHLCLDEVHVDRTVEALIRSKLP